MSQTFLFSRWEPQVEQPFKSNNAELWKVRDKTGEYAGDLALKIHRHIERRARFIQEVRILTELNRHEIQSPHVISILDYQAPEEDDGNPVYLVMPWMPGGDARKRAIKERHYFGKVDTALDVLIPLTSAIVHIHRLTADHGHYVAHRDIKPQNVLFDSSHRPVLTDFGCAMFDRRLTLEGERVGSLFYCAPEQLYGPFDGDPRPADIYSLAMLLYALLAATDPPERGRIFEEKYNLQSMSDDLRMPIINRLLASCIDTDPSRRPNALSLRVELEEIRDGTPESPTHPNLSSLNRRLGLLRFNPNIVTRTSAIDEVRALGDRVQSLAQVVEDTWSSHPTVIALTSNDDAFYIAETGCIELRLAHPSHLLPNLKMPAVLETSEEFRTLPADQIELAKCTTLSFVPLPQVGSSLPELQLVVAVVAYSPSDPLFVIGAIWTKIGTTSWFCDIYRTPICFQLNRLTSKSERQIAVLSSEIAAKSATILEEALEFTEENELLPLVREPFPAEKFILTKWDSLALTSFPPYYQHEFEVDERSDIATSRTGVLGFRRGGQLQLFDYKLERAMSVSGPGIATPSLSPHSDFVIFTHSGSYSNGKSDIAWGTLFKVDLTTGDVNQIYYCGNRSAGRCSWHPNGEKIAVSQGAVGAKPSRIISITPDGKLDNILYEAGADATLDFPLWSKDGSLLYFTRHGSESGLWKVALQSADQGTHLVGGPVAFPSLSPNGKSIAYVGSGSYPEYSIMVLELASGIARQVAIGVGGLAWEPERDTLLYIKGVTSEIYNGLVFAAESISLGLDNEQ